MTTVAWMTFILTGFQEPADIQQGLSSSTAPRPSCEVQDSPAGSQPAGSRDVPEGLYVLCSDVFGYSEEGLELRSGRYRYWFSSDAVGPDGDTHSTNPLTGKYHFENGRIILDHKKISRQERIPAMVNGTPVLWRDDGLKLWNEKKEIHPYAVLIHVGGSLETPGLKAPLIAMLESAKGREDALKAHSKRYEEQAEDLRGLLRMRSELNGTIDKYRTAVQRLRLDPSQTLVAQLIKNLNARSKVHTDCVAVLEDLYHQTWLMAEEHPFAKDKSARKKGLETLAKGLSEAPDACAAGFTLMVALRVTGEPKLDLAISGTNHRIKLERTAEERKFHLMPECSDDEFRSKGLPLCQEWIRNQTK